IHMTTTASAQQRGLASRHVDCLLIIILCGPLEYAPQSRPLQAQFATECETCQKGYAHGHPLAMHEDLRQRISTHAWNLGLPGPRARCNCSVVGSDENTNRPLI